MEKERLNKEYMDNEFEKLNIPHIRNFFKEFFGENFKSIKNYMDVAFYKCDKKDIPELILEFKLIDEDFNTSFTKDYILDAFYKCNKKDIPDLFKLCKKLDLSERLFESCLHKAYEFYLGYSNLKLIEETSELTLKERILKLKLSKKEIKRYLKKIFKYTNGSDIDELMIQLNFLDKELETTFFKDNIDKGFDKCSSHGILSLLELTKSEYPEKAKDYVRFDILNKCYINDSPKLIEQFRLIDGDKSKEIITKEILKNIFKKCDKSKIPFLLEQVRLFDKDLGTNISKDFVSKDIFEKCDDSNIHELIKHFRLIDCNKTKDYIAKAFKRCKDRDIHTLLEQSKFIDAEMGTNFEVIFAMESILRCSEKKLPMLVNKLTKEAIFHLIEEEDFDFDLLEFISEELINDPEFMQELMSNEKVKENVDITVV